MREACERHRLRVHAGHARVLHRLCVDLVTVRTRAEHHHPDEYSFVVLQSDAARKRGELANGNIIALHFEARQRTVIAPDLKKQLGFPAVGVDVLLRHRGDEHVDVVGHDAAPSACVRV
jgi:hypothetical protein